MEVEVEVNENDIVRVADSDTAMIEVDAYPDTRFKGVVSEIPVSANTTGVTTDQVTNFMVKILLLPESYADKVSESNPYPLGQVCLPLPISKPTRKQEYIQFPFRR